jgi:hypothetical protein
MANPQDYIPKPGDLVKAEGVIIKLVVVGVDPAAKTALVASPNDMSISYPVAVVQAHSLALALHVRHRGLRMKRGRAP